MPPEEYLRAIPALAYAGPRFGECAELIARDVDLAEGIMYVRRAASLDERGRLDAVARRPMSRAARTVPILEQLVPVRAEALRGKGELELVFPGPPGATLTSNTFRAQARGRTGTKTYSATQKGSRKFASMTFGIPPALRFYGHRCRYMKCNSSWGKALRLPCGRGLAQREGGLTRC